jgi:hypothetical protein
VASGRIAVQRFFWNIGWSKIGPSRNGNHGKFKSFRPNLGKFSKSLGYIRKIPLNPPLQKGEAVGMPELIEKLLIWAHHSVRSFGRF